LNICRSLFAFPWLQTRKLGLDLSASLSGKIAALYNLSIDLFGYWFGLTVNFRRPQLAQLSRLASTICGKRPSVRPV
jgi:hypothetical protein